MPLDAGAEAGCAGAGWPPLPQLARVHALTAASLRLDPADPVGWLAPLDVLVDGAGLVPAEAAWPPPPQAARAQALTLVPPVAAEDRLAVLARAGLVPAGVGGLVPLDAVLAAGAGFGPGAAALGAAELAPGVAGAAPDAVPAPVPPQLARTQAVTVTPGDGLSTVAACAAGWPSSMMPPMLAATIRPRSRVFIMVVPSEELA